MNASAEPAFLADAAALAGAAPDWAAASWLAIDTEFVRETTYYPRLCLVQLSDGGTPACVDAVALDAAALAPLWSVLAGPALKVLHAASQDYEIFVQHTGAAPAPLFDTQLAGALLGDGDQLGYAALVEKRLGVKLDKSLTRTDWSRRPLNTAELAYAADDVRYLAQLYPLLRDELEARGRLHWLIEDCARLADAGRYRASPELAWRRLKGLARLDDPARAAAAALAAWREEEAQRRDRPRKWILDDEPLYRLAQRRPQTQEQLEGLGALPPKTLARHAGTLLQLIEDCADTPPPQAEEWMPLEGADKARYQRLQALVAAQAQELGVPPAILAPRADLERLARGSAEPVQALQGWRREVIGTALLAAS